MRCRLVIFDFDGTLADSGPWFAGELNGVARRFGFREVDEAEMQALRRMDTRAGLRFLGVPPWKLPLIARHMRRRVAEEAESIPVFPGTPDMLRRLAARGLRLAVVSSNAEANIRRILGAEAALIGHYECGTSLFGKARRFRRVLRASGVAREAALCVGDEARDVEAARAAGLPVAAVAWGYAARELLAGAGPDFVFDGMEELLAELGA